jgi:O-antigen/teichoic acid export membrane protein
VALPKTFYDDRASTNPPFRASRVANSTAIRDISKLLSGSVLAKVFGVASLMLFSRVLPKDQMAIFPAYLTMLGLPSLFLSFGVFQTMIRKLPSLIREDESEARSLAMTASAVIIVGTVAVCLVALPFCDRIAVYFFRNAADAWIIRLSLVGCLAGTVSKIADFMMWGLGRFGATSLVQIIESAIRPCLTIALYFIFGIRGVVWGLVLAQLAMAAISLWFVRDMFIAAWPRLYPLRRLLVESFPFYIDNYLWYLKGDGDTLIVALLGPSILAEYYIAKNLYLNILLGWFALDRVALERLARFDSRSDNFRARAIEIQNRVGEFILPLMLLATALVPGMIVVLASTRYTSAIWPAAALLIVALIQFVNIANNRAVFVGLPGVYRLSTSAVEAVAVLIAAVCLIPRMGVMGVALARIAGPAIGGAYACLVLRSKLGLVLPWRPALRSLAAALPGTVLVLALTPVAHGAVSALWNSAIAGGAWSILFAVLTYALNRQAYDDARGFLLRQYRAAFSH